MTIREIRQAYLQFFSGKGHTIIPSASLIPEHDSTTLFTGSGMQPLLPYLLGQQHPQGVRLVNSQKCFRTQDIEEVGDNRHTTFFEMLGNWSLGDYFKEEQISWIYTFVTKELGLDPHRLFVTVFEGDERYGIPRDEESASFWQKIFLQDQIQAEIVDNAENQGIGQGRIFYYNARKNWWSRSGVPEQMPEGEPGGPDTELFWDFGESLRLHEQSPWKDRPCHPNCDCGRFMEIGNSVFMQWVRTKNGFSSLPKQNVDFGGGLERMAAAVQDQPDIFLIDVFAPLRHLLESLSGKAYGTNEKETHAFRILLDHLRAAVFLIADGVLPSNKDQGYFVRRLIRRAVRFAQQVGIEESVGARVVQTIVEAYKDVYPILEVQQIKITEALEFEEKKFRKTLQKGENELEKIFCQKGTISGQDAFVLYTTYGFPLELIEEVVKEKGMQIDTELFKEEFKKHQDLSRAGAEQKFAGGLADHSEETTKLHTATHLLLQALRQVLGSSVEQRGSNITEERLRFDFSHGEKLTQEQLQHVERIVNEQIKKGLPVHFETMSLVEAKEKGATGVFEEKYEKLGSQVKVYFIGDEQQGYFSKEVCGGPHVENTSALGHFTIKKEESIAAGIRRIKATLEKKA